MKDMFYNYDHNINKKNYPEILPEISGTEILRSDTNAHIIKNIKGDEIGIKAYAENPFSLYFNFTGHVSDEEYGEVSADYFLENNLVEFKLMDNRHVIQENFLCNNKTESNDVNLGARIDYIKNGEIKVDIIKPQQLFPGIYYIEVSVNDGKDNYTLYSESDGFIHLI